jgi:hypothetical protein
MKKNFILIFLVFLILLNIIPATAICSDTGKNLPVNIAIILYGDVNGNEKLDVGDAIMTLRYMVGLITLTDEQLTLAKVSLNEGPVDVRDVILILRKIVGLIDKFPIETI